MHTSGIDNEIFRVIGQCAGTVAKPDRLRPNAGISTTERVANRRSRGGLVHETERKGCLCVNEPAARQFLRPQKSSCGGGWNGVWGPPPVWPPRRPGPSSRRPFPPPIP